MRVGESNTCRIVHLLEGVVDIAVQDPKIVYLRNALLADEETLPGLGIKAGILGHNRSDYDIMLMPCEEKTPADSTEVDKRAVKTDEADDISVSTLRSYSDACRQPLTGRGKIESLLPFLGDTCSAIRPGGRVSGEAGCNVQQEI